MLEWCGLERTKRTLWVHETPYLLQMLNTAKVQDVADSQLVLKKLWLRDCEIQRRYCHCQHPVSCVDYIRVSHWKVTFFFIWTDPGISSDGIHTKTVNRLFLTMLWVVKLNSVNSMEGLVLPLHKPAVYLHDTLPPLPVHVTLPAGSESTKLTNRKDGKLYNITPHSVQFNPTLFIPQGVVTIKPREKWSIPLLPRNMYNVIFFPKRRHKLDLTKINHKSKIQTTLAHQSTELRPSTVKPALEQAAALDDFKQ